MLSLRPKPLTEAQIRAELAALAPRIAAAEDSRQSAADAVVNGDNADIYTAACANEGKLKARRDMLLDALPKAIEREAREAEAARTAEEVRLAKAAQEARETSERGARKITAAIDRALASVSFSEAAKALNDAIKSAEGWLLKIPDNAPWLSEHGNLCQYIAQYVAVELARAFDAYDLPVPTPGSLGVEPSSAWRKSFKTTLDDFARRTILEGERYRDPDPPKYRCTEIWHNSFEPAGMKFLRDRPGSAPSWRVGADGNPRPPTADEVAADLKYGAVIGSYWSEASGTPGITRPGAYHEYIDDAGRVVARFLWSSPGGRGEQRDEEAAWLASGCPILIHADVPEPEPAVDVPEPAAFEPLTEPSKAATVTDEGSLLLPADEGVAPETVAAPETLDQGNW